MRNENGVNSMRAVCLALCLAMPFFGNAQQEGNPQRDPMQDYFYPPELVMRYQDEVQLKPEQKEVILVAMEDAQKKFNRLQWDLQNAMSTFQGFLATPAIDEQKTLDQLDKVLDLERQIKKAQVTLMVRIKNALTSEQKEKLKTLKGK